MGKLSALVAVLAALLVGCAGEVEGPEEFAFTTDDADLYLRGTEAADQVNAEDPTVLVTVELLSPAATIEERHLANLIPSTASGLGPEWAGVTTNQWALVLMVGEDADIEAIKAGFREWIDRVSTRDPVE